MKRHLYHAICLLIFFAATYGFLAEVRSSGFNLAHYDKALHFLVFFCLTALLQWSYKPKLWQALAIMSVYGIAIEFLQQYLTSYRRAELLDWIADITGVVAFYLCYFAVKKWHHRKQ